MSIVLAVKKDAQLVIAADSQISFGGARIPYDNLRPKKIRRLGDSFFASTGWGLYDDIIDDFVAGKEDIRLQDSRSIFRFFLGLWKELHERYSFVNDQCGEEKDSPFGDLDSAFLIVNHAGLFQVGGDMSVTRFNQYYAIGSGADYALGALHSLYDSDLDAREIARRGVEAAIAFDTKCGGEVLLHAVSELPAPEAAIPGRGPVIEV